MMYILYRYDCVSSSGSGSNSSYDVVAGFNGDRFAPDHL
jgi:hypothetical protein